MKLYIIGNGFDLMHGMRTSYSDFRDWLLRKGRIDIIEEFQSVFNLKENDDFILWSDFERSLGEYDLDVALNWSLENLYLTVTGIGGQLFESRTFFRNTQIDDIVNEVFPEWVRLIPLASHQMKTLDMGAYYFTFNYTDTLERLYSISEDRVYHIHGRSSRNENLVVGHDKYRNPSEYWDENLDMRENNERMQRITDMNDLCKPIQSLIEKAKPFFDRLKDVDTIEVIGHSCSKVDFPYFAKLKNSCVPEAQWIFSPHSNRDKMNIQKLKDFLGVNGNCECSDLG